MRKSLLFLSLFVFIIIFFMVLMCMFPIKDFEENLEEFENGVLTEYYDNGHILSRTNYERGKRNGIQTVYYENGNVLRTVSYIKDFKVGEELVYYKNSLLKSRVFYVNGSKEGEATTYFNDNNFSSQKRPVKAKVVFKNDKAILGYCYLAGTDYKIVFNEAHLHNFEIDMSTPCDIVRKE